MGLIRSAHDCSEGGLAVALAECCVSGAAPLGAKVRLGGAARLDQALFNESQSRIVVSVSAGNATAVEALFTWRGILVQRLGTIGGQTLEIECGEAHLSWPCSELHAAWHGSIARCMGAA
jgi:phosphoribosylformylglycinamidine synthase